MKSLIGKILLFGLCVMCMPFNASGGWFTGELDKVYCHQSNYLCYLSVKGNPSTKPACATHGTYSYVFSTSGPGGQTLLAEILAAGMGGKNVTISGKDSCALHGQMEDIGYLVVEF